MLQYCIIRPCGKRTGTHRTICYNTVLSVLVGRVPEHTEQYATILYYPSSWEEDLNTPNNMLQSCTIHPGWKRTGTHRTICYNTVLSVLVGRRLEHTEQYATILYYPSSWEEDRNTPNNMLQYCIIRPRGKSAGTHQTICYNTVLSVLVGGGPEHTEQYATKLYYPSWWEEDRNTPNNMLQSCTIHPGGKRTGTHRTICYNTVLSVLVGRGPEHTEQYATILYYPSWWEEDRNTPNNMLQSCTIHPGGKRTGTHRTICYNTVLFVLVGRGPEHTEQYATILYCPSEAITNTYISSAIIPTKTIVGNRPDTSSCHVANRISVMTEISKASHIELSIIQIDSAIGQCPYQTTRINYINRYLAPILKCSKYFQSCLCNISLWNSQSLNTKITIFVDSLLTNKTDISIVTGTWLNSCDDTVEARFKITCKDFTFLIIHAKDEEVAVLLLCQNFVH